MKTALLMLFGGTALALLAPQPAYARHVASTAAPDEYHARARTVVGEILSRREFAELEESTWARRIRDVIVDFFRSIPKLFDHMPRWLGYLLLAWMLLTLLAILAHLLYVISGMLGIRDVKRAAGAPSPRELHGVTDLDPDSVYAEALRRLGEQDWTEAVRYLYVAAILWLDRAGFVRLRESKTNRDYVRELAARPACRAPFENLTRCFENSIYGGRPADQAICNEMTAHMEALAHVQRPQS